MADSKITGLTSFDSSNTPYWPPAPASDVIPIVDISDNTMAASGTTKKISINNLLSSSPTAGGNFTITGDLTVDTSTLKVDSTNNRVGIGTASPNNTLTVRGSQDAGIEVNSADSNASRIITAYDPANSRFYINSTSSGSGTVLPLDFLIGNSAQYRIAASGVFTWYDGAGGTRMTLNSTGLGVGVSPSGGTAGSVFSAGAVLAAGGLTANQTNRAVLGYSSNETTIRSYGATAGTGFITFRVAGGGGSGDTEAARIDSSGNVIVNTAAVATTATDGFLYITGCAGTPTGTPTAKTGRVPLVVDTTNNKLYFYSGGAWVAAN